MASAVPVFINCRDRVRDLRGLVAWLEAAGHERIVLLDNASTWEPLLAYLAESPHEVRRLGVNRGSRALWEIGAPDEWFVYTDPDIVPIRECPNDAVEHLREVAQRHPGHPKVGLGLYLEDVPPQMPSLALERSYYAAELEPGVFDAPVDTTFALYRPRAQFTYRALRCGWPYQARHMSWYRAKPGEEDTYYLERAACGPLGSSWADQHNKRRKDARPCQTGL